MFAPRHWFEPKALPFLVDAGNTVAEIGLHVGAALLAIFGHNVFEATEESLVKLRQQILVELPLDESQLGSDAVLGKHYIHGVSHGSVHILAQPHNRRGHAEDAKNLVAREARGAQKIHLARAEADRFGVQPAFEDQRSAGAFRTGIFLFEHRAQTLDGLVGKLLVGFQGQAREDAVAETVPLCALDEFVRVHRAGSRLERAASVVRAERVGVFQMDDLIARELHFLAATGVDVAADEGAAIRNHPHVLRVCQPDLCGCAQTIPCHVPVRIAGQLQEGHGLGPEPEAGMKRVDPIHQIQEWVVGHLLHAVPRARIEHQARAGNVKGDSLHRRIDPMLEMPDLFGWIIAPARGAAVQPGRHNGCELGPRSLPAGKRFADTFNPLHAHLPSNLLSVPKPLRLD